MQRYLKNAVIIVVLLIILSTAFGMGAFHSTKQSVDASDQMMQTLNQVGMINPNTSPRTGNSSEPGANTVIYQNAY